MAAMYAVAPVLASLVTALDESQALTDKGLFGTLTPLISFLSALEILELSGNKLTGTIPSLAGMASLTHLVLNDNGFTSLPYDFFHGLTSLTSQLENGEVGASFSFSSYMVK